MRCYLPLLFCAVAATSEALPRLPETETGWPPPRITSVGDWQQYRPAIGAWLKETWPSLQADDPGVAALNEMLARWTHDKDGTASLSTKYAAIYLAQFNRYQTVREAVEASALPGPCRVQWLRFAAERLLRERLAADVAPWIATLRQVPAGGTVVEGDAAAIVAGIRKAIPGFDGTDAAERRRLLHALAALNPALEADGWCSLEQAPAAETGIVMAVSPQGGGRQLVERWRVDGNAVIYIPPPAGLTAVAPPDPSQAGSTAVPLRVVRCTLAKGWLGKYPLDLQLAFRPNGTFDNGVITAPSLCNRAWPAYPPDSATQPNLQPPTFDNGRITGSLRSLLSTMTRAKSGSDALVASLDLDASGAGQAELSLNGSEAVQVTSAPTPARPPIVVANGAEWRNWMGTRLDAAGRSAGLVTDLEDAVLSWSCVDDMPDGRGPDTRGKARAMPLGEPLSGTYCTPVVAGGLVFTTAYEPSGMDLAYGAKDPLGQRINLIAADDVVTAVELATGAVRWQRRFPGGINWAGFNKGGPKLSAAVADGMVVTVGTTGRIRGLDAATGELRWENSLGYRERQMQLERARCIAERSMLSTRNDFMIDPVIIAGTVLICDARRTKIDYRYEIDAGMLAFDLQTGRSMWRRPELAPPNRFYQGPQLLSLGGQDWALVPHERGSALLDPRSGQQRWDCPAITLHQQGMAQLDDLVLGEEPKPANAPKEWVPGLVAVRVSASGAQLVWKADPALGRMAGNPIARDGRFWVVVEKPQRQLVALSAADGKTQLALPLSLAGGEHCPFLADAGDRLIMPSDRTAGYWLVTPDPAKPEPRYWPTRLATGYCGSIMPALVDGRMLLRSSNRLLCYDLRSSAASPREHAADWKKATPTPPAAAEKDKDKDKEE